MASTYPRHYRTKPTELWLRIKLSGRHVSTRAPEHIQALYRVDAATGEAEALELARTAERQAVIFLIASLGSHDKAKARAWLEEQNLFRFLDPTAPAPRPTRGGPNTVSGVIEDFSTSGRLDLAENTRREYLYSLGTWRRWCRTHLPAGELTAVSEALAPQALIDYQRHRRANLLGGDDEEKRTRGITHGKRALLADIQALAALESWLLSLRRLEASTVRQTLQRPRIPKKSRTLPSDEQIAALLETAAAYKPNRQTNYIRFDVLLWTAIATGLRRDELLHLAWSDFDGSRITVQAHPEWGHTLKTASSHRRVPILAELSTALSEYRESLPDAFAASSAPIFAQGRDKPKPAADIRTALDAIFTAAGIPNSGLHNLRTLACVRFLRSIKEMARVSRLMGHETMATTQEIYARHIQELNWEEDYHARMEPIPRAKCRVILATDRLATDSESSENH